MKEKIYQCLLEEKIVLKLTEKFHNCYLVMKFQLYCEESASKTVKLSKFYGLRPKYILTYKGTPLETCGCVYHSNFSYLCAGLASKIPFPLCCNKWLENYVLCKPPTYQCWIMKCSLFVIVNY